MPLPSRQEAVLGGRYRLDEPIGRGGTSVVWRAHDEVLDRDVAVKILGDGGERFRQRLRMEASAAGRLRNAHIAHMYDYGEFESEDGKTTPYLVMELVDGQLLSRRLAGGDWLDWPTAVGIGAEVATALAAAHADGLVHRDVKPDNVLLTADGVKLIDFGISATVGSDDVEADGRVLGTVAYLAPERLAGAPVGPAADVYALGVMLYRMLAGGLPWPVTERDDLLNAHLHVDPTPLPLIAGAPPALVEICNQCLSKDPSRRPTAAQLVTRLRRLATRTAAAAVPLPAAVPEPTAEITPLAGVPTIGRRRARPAVALMAVAAVAVAAAVIGLTGRDGTPRADAGAVPPTAPCVAIFSVQRDWGSGFEATLTVVNTGAAIHGWRIAFDFTGGQHLTAASSVVSVAAGDRSRHTATLRQAGKTVTASNPRQALDPHESVTVPVTGRYTKTNPIPLDFRLNDRQCVAQVAGATNRATPGGGAGSGGAPAGPSGSATATTGGSPASGGTTTTTPTGTPSGAPSAGTTAPAPPGTTPPNPPPSTTAPPTGATSPPAPPSDQAGDGDGSGRAGPAGTPAPHQSSS